MSLAVIKNIEKNSIAEEIGLTKGDVLISVNGQKLLDILDYKYQCASGEYEIEIQKQNGDIEIIEIINDDYEDLGIEFEDGLLDKPQVCRNKCLFCFVDQLPKGMRKTLYFKDDDYRLSTLMGNYITLTNLNDDDIDRIINMHLPRINISVHASDLNVRRKLLNNINSDIMPIIKRFSKAGITMNCQIVLCDGINDGEVLDSTILELAKFYPNVQSLSVVPVGITMHRKHLPTLNKFDKIASQQVIAQIEKHQDNILKSNGTRFVYASDEFYVTAKYPIPSYESYEDFLQIDNGVGMLSSLKYEFETALKQCNDTKIKTKKTIATGVSAAPYINELVCMVTDNINVIPIINSFFGDTITVCGLLTAKDIINQLKGKDLGDVLLLPSSLINYDGLLLDDYKILDIENELNIKVITVENDGYDLLEKILA